MRPTVSVGVIQQDDRLRVSEIFAIAVLRAQGVPFLGTESRPGRRVVFNFDDSGGRARALVEAHQREGVTVNSLTFASAITWARDVIFSTKE